MATAIATMLATSAAGGAAAGGAAAGAGLLGSSSTLFAIGSTVVSGLASLASGSQQSAALKSQARFAEFEASQEVIKGRQDALELQKQLNDDLAASTVAGFASGLRSSGSVDRAKDDAIREGEFQIDTARDNAAVRAGSRRQQARQFKLDAKGARTAGLFGALKAGFNFLGRQQARG